MAITKIFAACGLIRPAAVLGGLRRAALPTTGRFAPVPMRLKKRCDPKRAGFGGYVKEAGAYPPWYPPADDNVAVLISPLQGDSVLGHLIVPS